MKKFKVLCNETKYGSKVFKAETEEEAIKLAEKYIEENGIDITFDVFDREFNAEFANEIPDD